MKRLLFGLIGLLAMLAAAGVGMSAAAPEATTSATVVGPYEGTFHGVAQGDRGTSAPIMLELTHRGSQVSGIVALGEGLYVSAGFCGAVNVPATTLRIGGQTVAGNPNRLVASPSFDVGGFDVAVDFESNVSRDAGSIVAEAKVDLPWFCGGDPTFASTLYRD